MKLSILLVALATTVTVLHAQGDNGACDSKFLLVTGHSACSVKASNLVKQGISAAFKRTIVDEHNKYRKSVSPPAANMQKMVWDDELAMIAQKRALACPLGHETNLQRSVPGRFFVGQNLAFGYANWKETIKAWYDEVNDFTYGQPPAPGKKVLHYTQIVWATTSKVGCGYAVCRFGSDDEEEEDAENSVLEKIYICNYGPGGNIKKQDDLNSIYKPYEIGSYCSACSSSCVNNLCDCGGLACNNGGIMDVNSCHCDCHKDYYRGESCDLDCSRAKDSWGCGSGYKRVMCQDNQVAFSVHAACPIMCGLCDSHDT